MVTGATSGIGEACARQFINAGYRVIATGRNVTKLNLLKEEFGSDLLPLVFDVRDREIAEASVKALPGAKSTYLSTMPDWHLAWILNIRVITPTGKR